MIVRVREEKPNKICYNKELILGFLKKALLDKRLNFKYIGYVMPKEKRIDHKINQSIFNIIPKIEELKKIKLQIKCDLPGSFRRLHFRNERFGINVISIN